MNSKISGSDQWKMIKGFYNKWTVDKVKHFGEMIFAFLEIVDWSQNDLARELGVSKQLVSKWINDKTTKLDLVTAWQISEVVHNEFYRYFNYDTGDIIIRYLDVKDKKSKEVDLEFAEEIKKAILNRWDKTFLTVVGWYKESQEDQHMVRHHAQQQLEEIRENNMAEMWNSYSKEFEESSMDRFSNIVLDFDINAEMISSSNLKDLPSEKELTSIESEELLKLGAESQASYLSSFKQMMRAIAIREVVENTMAQKILGPNLYELAYNVSTADDSDVATTEKIWKLNAEKVGADPSFTYMAWQQRKMRRYQMLISLQTLFNVNNHFEYNLKDKNLVEAMKQSEPVLHFNSDQIKYLKGDKRKELAYWIFGKEPAVQEGQLFEQLLANKRGVSNAK